MKAQLGGSLPTRNTKKITACFSVVAESDPNALSRILEPFTKRGLTPWHVYATHGTGQARSLNVDVHLADADEEVTRRIANDLRGLWLVDTVLTSEKRYAETAKLHP